MEHSMILNICCSIYSDWRKIRAISSGAIDSFRLELEAQRFDQLSIQLDECGEEVMALSEAHNVKSAKTCFHPTQQQLITTTCIIGEYYIPDPV